MGQGQSRFSELSQLLLKHCRDGCTAEVGVFKNLLNQGADPNIKDELEYCHYPLWYASRYGKRDLVELFLQYKADVNLKTTSRNYFGNGETALHAACGHGHIDVAFSLLYHGAVVDSQDKYGWTALHHASRSGHTDVVKLLLDSGAQIDNKHNGFIGREGTALHAACVHGHIDVATLLLNHGAEVDSQDEYRGWTALHHASNSGHTDIVKLLVDSGAQLDNEDSDGRTALHSASYCGHTGVVKLLVDSGAQIDNNDKDGRTALHHASRSGHTGVVKLLVDSRAQIDSKDKDGWTALYYASSSGHTNVVKLLVNSGAEIDIKNSDGRTALHSASYSGHTGVVKLLVDSGAQIDNKDKIGLTALHRATNSGHTDAVKLLADSGAQIDIKDNDGWTALHYASSSGHTNVVKLLVDSGAEIDIKNSYGRTALHRASSSGHTDVIELLVDCGAGIEKKDNDGRTALHLASSSHHTDAVRLLVDSGAKIDNRDKYGRTPLDQAKKYGHMMASYVLECEAPTRPFKTEEPSSIGDSETKADKLSGSSKTGEPSSIGDSETERDIPSDDVSPTASDSDDISSAKVPDKNGARPKSPALSGQILLKHELVALAKLLAAYSDEKLKEIELNLQKKQGGDISREEVERSLRESGLSSIASDLKENLEKSVEDQQHYEAYKSALKGGLALTMQYLKFLFFGPPRTGKSTARRRLVQEIVNLKNLGEPSASTGVAEANDVIIKKLTSEPAAISGSQWWSMKKSKEDGQIDEGDCDYLAQLFYRLISKTMSEAEQATTVPATVSEPALSMYESESEESDIAETTDIKQASTPLKSPKLQDHTKKDLLAEFQAELSSVPLSNSEEKEIDEAFKKLTSTLQSDSPEELRKLLEDLTMLNMVDIGGQSAFLELCPAFTTGPALYLIFFRLDQELKKNYQIKFQSADGEETVLESSYCTETVVHQTLSSIACFERRSTAESAKSAPSSIVSGRAILVGTYKDKVDDERISQMNIALRQQLEHTKLYKEDLLLQASENTLFYSLNNMTGDDSEVSPIRKDIEIIIKNMFSKVDIPASWLMFRIILHFLHKPVVSVTECEEIARRLSMTTPVQEAIWFFHHNVGSLMHYPDIPSMKDIVICDSQVIFDSTSELIIDTFKVSNRDIPQSAVKDFREKGQFSLEHIKDRTESHRRNHLSLKQLVDLLKSHNILAEIKSDQESSEQLQPSQESSAQSNQYQPKFVMPAVLKEASEEELDMENAKPEAAPLIIHFEGGFVPFGVFCASIANLIAHQDALSPRWQLCDGQVMKNKVKFCIDKSFYATLISRPQYFKIRVERHPRAVTNHTLSSVCSTVRQTFVLTLETVISKMRYTSHTTPMLSTVHSFNLAFACCLEECHSDHLMQVDTNGYSSECVKDSIRLSLEEKHLIWFDNDYCSSSVAQLDASSNSSASGEVNEAVKTQSNKPDAATKNVQKLVKSGQIIDPDRLFNNLALEISDKYEKIGIELGLQSKVLRDELETGRFMMLQGSKKALRMLQLWQQSVAEDSFTYSVLAAALEKHGFQHFAHKYCYTSR